MAASKAMVDTEATATMITLVDTTAVTVADMTTVSTDCSWGFFPAPRQVLVNARDLSTFLCSFLTPLDQGNTSYGKTPRRGAHQSSYKPY